MIRQDQSLTRISLHSREALGGEFLPLLKGCEGVPANECTKYVSNDHLQAADAI